MKKILIVDDDKNIIKALSFGLNKYYQIVFAHTVEVATRAIRILEPAAVITDLNFVQDSGITLLELCRDICPDIKRILMTGDYESIDEEDSLIDLLIKKPFLEIEKIRNVIG